MYMGIYFPVLLKTCTCKRLSCGRRWDRATYQKYKGYMRHSARFGTFCTTLYKRGKHPWRSSTSACNVTKSNTPPWVFFKFFRLYKWYKMAQGTTYKLNDKE